MVVIVGCIVVMAAVLGGFTLSGGHVGALIHPAEILTIAGAAFGAMIVMAPMKVLKDLARGLLQSLKGSPFSRKAYNELFQVMYEFFRLARREGLLALEPHLSDPHRSTIMQKYPSVHHNHHITEFICGSIAPVMDGSVTPQQLPGLLDAELKAMAEEHHAPVAVLAKTADALPGFGIVAAVLGIVITMGAIDGPVEEIGHKVGAALVGTFLGILLSYGFFGPLVTKMEFMGVAELAYFQAIATMVQGFADNQPPKIVLEVARRGLSHEVRPTQEELETLLKAVDSGG
ncbi:MAG TPA: flagellar motor stator protein MotA [Pirellulaceae bacterium]|nr:flagellar motor stator protein MotA [Pirellulaceae bacterium]